MKFLISFFVILLLSGCEFFLNGSKNSTQNEETNNEQSIIIEKVVYGTVLNRYFIADSEIYLQNQEYITSSDENGSFEKSQDYFINLNQHEIILEAKNGKEFSFNSENNMTLKTIFLTDKMQQSDRFEVIFSLLTTIFVDFYKNSSFSFDEAISKFKTVFDLESDIFSNHLMSSSYSDLLTANFKLNAILDILSNELLVEQNLTPVEKNDILLSEISETINSSDSNLSGISELMEAYVNQKIEELNSTNNIEINSTILENIDQTSNEIDENVAEIIENIDSGESFIDSLLNSIEQSNQQNDNTIVIQDNQNSDINYLPTDFKPLIDDFISIGRSYLNYSLEFILTYLSFNNSTMKPELKFVKFDFKNKNFSEIEFNEFEYFYIYDKNSENILKIEDLYFQNNKNYLKIFTSNDFNSEHIFEIYITSISNLSDNYFLSAIETYIKIYKETSESIPKEYILMFKANQDIEIIEEQISKNYESLELFLSENNIQNSDETYYIMKDENIFKVQKYRNNQIFFEKTFFNNEFLYSFKIYLLTTFLSIDLTTDF
jgi:hypothetical protein